MTDQKDKSNGEYVLPSINRKVMRAKEIEDSFYRGEINLTRAQTETSIALDEIDTVIEAITNGDTAKDNVNETGSASSLLKLEQEKDLLNELNEYFNQEIPEKLPLEILIKRYSNVKILLPHEIKAKYIRKEFNFDQAVGELQILVDQIERVEENVSEVNSHRSDVICEITNMKEMTNKINSLLTFLEDQKEGNLQSSSTPEEESPSVGGNTITTMVWKGSRASFERLYAELKNMDFINPSPKEFASHFCDTKGNEMPRPEGGNYLFGSPRDPKTQHLVREIRKLPNVGD